MINIFAHAGESHEDLESAASHSLAEPLIALSIFILLVAGLYYLLTALKVSKSSIMLIELSLFFVVGVATYTLIPVVSIFALTVGITGTLFVTLSNLAHG